MTRIGHIFWNKVLIQTNFVWDKLVLLLIQLLFPLFQYFTYLARHIMYTHETEKPWKCEHCDFAHALKAGLLAHSKGCQPKESSYKVCHLCGYKTVYNAMLKVHIESKHEKKKRFKCNICDACFYENTKLQRHMRGQFSNWFPLHTT